VGPLVITVVHSIELDRRNERKWGKEVMAADWLAIPSVLLQRQNAFDILDRGTLKSILRAVDISSDAFLELIR